MAIIYAGSKNLLRNIPVDKVKSFETAFLSNLKKNNKKELSEVKLGLLNDDLLETLKKVAEETSKAFE